MALATAVEIASTSHPPWFLLFGSAAALLREAGGALSGPSYLVFLDAFATGANIGDLCGRGNAQVVMGNLIGLGVGVTIAQWLATLSGSDRIWFTTIFYIVLAVGHLLSTRKAVDTVHLASLNAQRLHIVVGGFLRDGVVRSVPSVNADEGIRSLAEVEDGAAERVQLGVGVAAMTTTEGVVVDEVVRRVEEDGVATVGLGDRVGVVLRDGGSGEEMVLGVLMARKQLMEIETGSQSEEAGVKAREWTRRHGHELMDGLRREGWHTDKVTAASGAARLRWGCPETTGEDGKIGV